MHLKSFRNWVRQVYVTQDEELDCDGCLEKIPQYVDIKVAGEKEGQHFPDVKHHLRQCAECYDLYLTLRHVAQLEIQQVTSELTKPRRS